MSAASIRQTLAVKLGGPFLMAREAARFMTCHGGGVIYRALELVETVGHMASRRSNVRLPRKATQKPPIILNMAVWQATVNQFCMVARWRQDTSA